MNWTEINWVESNCNEFCRAVLSWLNSLNKLREDWVDFKHFWTKCNWRELENTRAFNERKMIRFLLSEKEEISNLPLILLQQLLICMQSGGFVSTASTAGGGNEEIQEAWCSTDVQRKLKSKLNHHKPEGWGKEMSNTRQQLVLMEKREIANGRKGLFSSFSTRAFCQTPSTRKSFANKSS